MDTFYPLSRLRRKRSLAGCCFIPALVGEPNRPLKRYSIFPSAEGNISGFCSQLNFAAMPNRRLVLLDKTRFCGTNPLRGFVRMEH